MHAHDTFTVEHTLFPCQCRVAFDVPSYFDKKYGAKIEYVWTMCCAKTAGGRNALTPYVNECVSLWTYARFRIAAADRRGNSFTLPNQHRTIGLCSMLDFVWHLFFWFTCACLCEMLFKTESDTLFAHQFVVGNRRVRQPRVFGTCPFNVNYIIWCRECELQ